jgi:hypothetical protein
MASPDGFFLALARPQSIGRRLVGAKKSIAEAKKSILGLRFVTTQKY